jgi:hypothetical protein
MKATSIVVASENVQIKRIAKRRHLLLNVSHNEITVKAPYYASNREIHRFVIEHLDWIARQKQKLPPETKFRHGEEFFYLGYPRMLNVHLAKRAILIEENDIFLYHPNPTELTIKRQLKAFFQSEATNYLSTRTKELATLMQLKTNAVEIKTYKARWGSCDAKGQIQLNWKLMMAPPETIDYVIVHELCHLVHFNHSNAFWQLVANFMPDYKIHKRWLNQHSPLLNHVFS